MPRDVSSMAVWLEGMVESLGAAKRLRWEGAVNHANYYHESTNGFYDGIAACLSALAERFDTVKTENDDSSYFLREAADELWALTGEQRRWQDADRRGKATAMLHLVSALDIEGRRISAPQK